MTFTGYVAIYAAVLSTLIFIWNVRKSKPKVSVSIILGVESKKDDAESIFGVYVTLKNPSLHTVHINHISFLYMGCKKSFWNKLLWILEYRRYTPYIGWVHTSSPFENLKTGLPISIEPHQSHSIFVPEENIRVMLEGCDVMHFGAVAQDALDRNKYSKSFEMYPPLEN